MFGRALTWPKLIGCAVGLVGAGFAVSAFGAGLQSGLFTRPPDLIRSGTWLTLLGSVLLCGLSLPLYHSHDWARRVLFAISLIASAALLLFCLLYVFREPQMSIDGSFTAEQIASFRHAGRIDRLISAAVVLCLFALQGFFTLALQHSDVVQAFRRTTIAEDGTNI